MKPAVRLYALLADRVVDLFARAPATHQVLLGPGLERLRWDLGRLRAYGTFEHAARTVPAYRAFLAARKHPARLVDDGPLWDQFEHVPVMDKDNYIRAYPTIERCVGGKFPRRGVVVDESSGSSGTPTSWVRGPLERRATRQLLQVGYVRTAAELTKQPFVINAFSLGAWATGMNITASLTEQTMIKSVGPDRDKIIATMKEFGPDFTYIITSYPPFLKGLLEDQRLDWSAYDVVCAFGGESISESMRDHILRTAKAVVGSYGASDLEINIAIETDFTIALRRAVAADPALSAALTRQSEYGVLPSIFQFNPYAYVIETNDQGELLVTITRRGNINPRIRYNIRDRGHVVRAPEVTAVLRRLGHQSVLEAQLLDLPVLFHYGRSDLSVDYNGAVVPPDGLRDVVNAEPVLMAAVANHRLVSYEDSAGNRQLHLALQLAEGAELGDREHWAEYIFARLREANADFRNAVRTCSPGTEPTLGFYAYRTGVFAGDGAKLKNEYVWQLAAADAEVVGLDPQFRAST